MASYDKAKLKKLLNKQLALLESSSSSESSDIPIKKHKKSTDRKEVVLTEVAASAKPTAKPKRVRTKAQIKKDKDRMKALREMKGKKGVEKQEEYRRF